MTTRSLFRTTRVVVAWGMLCAFALRAEAALIDVALLGADSTARVDEVRTNLLATGKFNTIAQYAVGSMTPTLGELNQLVGDRRRCRRNKTKSN